MTALARVDSEGYLLSRSFHKSKLTKEVDISKYTWLKFEKKTDSKKYDKFKKLFEDKEWDKIEKLGEEYWIAKLYNPYYKMQDDDKVYEYDDIGVLSGSAGYLLIRNGYVTSVYSTRRS